MRFTRGARIVVLAASLLALSASPASARTHVDPNTLNPPPPDFFNAVCETNGHDTICTLHFSDPDIVDEPSGIVCGGTELLFSQSRSVVGKRFYDGNGNLTQRHFRESFSGTVTNPDTGNTAVWVQHDTVIQNLGVPGDLSTGTTKITGLFTRAWAPGSGTIFTDAGTFLIDETAGEVIHSGGHHPLDDYFSGADPNALAPLCDALA